MAYEKTQQKRIDAGLCKDCGKSRGQDGTSIRCRVCAKDAATRSSKRKDRLRKIWSETGLCYNCGAKKEDKTVLCTNCKEKQSLNHEKYGKPKRLKNEKAGLCRYCGKERYHASNYCRQHFIQNLAHVWKVPRSLWEDLLQKLEKSDFTCFYTGEKLVPGKNACVDHLYSRSQHPDKISDLDNLVWCDKWVNRMKGYMSYQDFIALCHTIVKHDEMRLD